jgi:hypothetical protein
MKAVGPADIDQTHRRGTQGGSPLRIIADDDVPPANVGLRFTSSSREEVADHGGHETAKTDRDPAFAALAACDDRLGVAVAERARVGAETGGSCVRSGMLLRYVASPLIEAAG